MKRLYLLFAIVFAFSILNAQETYRFRTDAPQGFTIGNSTASGLSLHYALNEITVEDHHNGDAHGQEIIMKGSFGSFAEGLPNLPFENRYIAVPRGAKVSIKVRENGCQTLNGIELLPAAEVVLNSAAKLPELRKDMSVFGKDTNFPTENVAIAQTTQIRGLDVVMLNVTPFRYNPVKKTLEVIYDMDIELSFEGGDGQFGDARYRNPAWDNILRDLVINSDILPEAHYYERLNEAVQNREEGCEYLIIIPDNPAFVAWADTLKQFRTKQGILTKVVSTTDCGGNEPEDIRNFILNAYENWSIPPAAILLFGENHKGAPEFGLKPFLFTSPPSYGETYIYASDNPFADMNGDSIPDLAISRLVTKYPSECQRQVEKLIQYELNPPTDPHYYDHPVITSGYQADKWFMITSQCVNSFFCNKLGKHTTNNYMVFDQMNPEPTPPDSIWSTGYNTDAVLDYFGPNGTNYIPLSIGGLDNWGNMEDIQSLVDAMSEGGFLTFYRDHSAENTWCCPWFGSNHIPLLQNESPTFIFSIGCLTNNFWDNWTTCLSESFLSEEVGAIGTIGANTVTFSHFNDLISWGMLDYLWPDFMPTLGSHTDPNFSYPSYALVAGKLFLSQQSFLPYTSDTIKVEKTLNVFSYLGETYLNLYTEVPQQMQIEANPYTSSQSYTITAEEGATICLSYGDEIVMVTQATGQPQSLTIPDMPIGDRFHVTVTKHNRFRFERDVTVVSLDQPFVYLKGFRLNDQDGSGQLDYGEYAGIDLTLSNANSIVSEGSEVTLLCESPYIEILQGTAHYSNISPEAPTTIADAFRIKLSNDVPDQTVLSFRVKFNEDENTHEDDFSLVANAPNLQINPEFHPTTAEGKPSTHIGTERKSYITFSISNIGHSTAEYLCADLNIKAPFVSVETMPLHEKLEPDETCSLSYELNAQPNEVTGAWLQSRLDVQYGAYHTCLDTIIQYGGIFENFETDTLNPLFQWANQGSYSWVYCDEDAYEGNRCFTSRADTIITHQSLLRGRLKRPWVTHHCKISFQYKTDDGEQLRFKLIKENYLSSDEWEYAEYTAENSGNEFYFKYTLNNSNSAQAKIDNLCFPPTHTTIAYAGDDLIACDESPVELKHAYAYDCDSIVWTTEGNGHFDDDTIANPTYFPGSQDLANGDVALTLTAFGDNTIVSTTRIRFVDGFSLSAIAGDSIVNKYEQQVSHYSVDYQEGARYHWQLEPADVGYIYDYGNAIDILWNLHESDLEAILSVTAENGCEVEPITKTISLIGYDLPEWSSVSFDLFPNPTEERVNLVVGETLQGKAVVEVYNLLGERIMAKNAYHLQKGETLCLDLSSFVSGLYIIKLSTEVGSCTKKVSVK